MKKPQIVLACLALLFALIPFGRAQTGDDAVSVVADEMGLQLLSPDSVPATGTFWTATTNADSIIPPFPCLLLNTNLPVYQISPGQFLADETMSDAGESASNILAQADAVSNLITQVQVMTIAQTSRTMGIHALDDSGPPSFSDTNDDGGNYYTNLLSLPPINTNLLWLQITNVANGLAYLNLNMATDTVYAIFGTTNLLTPFTNWQVFAEVWPTNETTNVLPFTVETDNNTNLFWQAEDWTGVTVNGNTTPLWWFWEYFATEDLSDTNLDSQGNTLLDDYQGGFDPNIIDFTLSTTNKYVRSSNVSAQINLTAGWPSYYAVLVNDTNETGAVWLPYPGTNLILTLGSTNGIYNVSIGLRGLPTNATPTWNSFDLQYLYQTLPPVLTITNPVSGAVTQPMIQIQGFANVPLASLRYDLSNTNGLFTNQTGYLTSQYYDPNQLAATTNYFQCYDVPMTPGSNTITLHAVDLAGNVGTTNFNLTLDYSGVTSPPALALVWPQPGTLIGGSNFTLQATVNDDTAKVAASIAGTNGVTNTVAAVVERNGNVWANNLPLTAGTNLVTLTATNAAGLVNTTNFTVVQSAVNVTVNPISSDQLNQTTVSVTGTVTPGQNVYVNGVQASVDDSGNWTASGVPVNPTGTANLNVQATTPDGSLDSAQVANQAQPVMVVLAGYNGSWVQGDENAGDDVTVNWTYDVGGDSEDSVYVPGYHGQPSIEPRGNGLGAQPMERLSYANSDISPDGPGFTPPPGFAPTWQNEQSSLANDGGDSTLATTVTVASSGPSVVGQSQFYLVEACAMEFSDPYDDDYNLLEQNFGGGSTGDVPVSPELLAINGQTLINTGEINTDGSTWGATIISAPAGAPPQFTVGDDSFDGLSDDFTFTNQAFPIHLAIIDMNSGVDLTLQTNTVIVGQQMNFTAQLSITNSFMTNFPLSNFQWTVPGYAISNYVANVNTGVLYTNFATNSTNVAFYWADNATNRIVQCSVTMNNGQTITGQATFDVVRPNVQIPVYTGTIAVDTNFEDGLFAFHYGDIDFRPNVAGILFTNLSVMPIGVSYNHGNTNFNVIWIQEVNSSVRQFQTNDASGIWYERYSAFLTNSVLDSYYPAQTLYTNSFLDAPYEPLTNAPTSAWKSVIISDSFTTWLMFKPSGGGWVPLENINWSWGGTATLGTVPTNGNYWSLTAPTNSVSTNSDSFTYPTWNANIQNYTAIVLKSLP